MQTGIQSTRQVSLACESARKIGYTNFSFDLIYGLARQKPESIRKSMQQALEYKPERLAYYPYIPVPQSQNVPRLFSEAELPQDRERQRLYECGREILLGAGYQDLGMDHYVLEEDPLWQAKKKGTLRRYFTDYSPYTTDLLLGLGSSAISESSDCYHQNEKILLKYQKTNSYKRDCPLQNS